jgi:ABC-type Zn uptake system ZnuABC Zn-binding protein ZnuA
VVFVGRSVNPNLAERIAEDTGVELIFLYTGSLSGEGGPAPTYLEMMRYDVGVMVEGLN